MIHLVYGGSGSGKSAYAENLVMRINSKHKYYLATMKIFGKEGLLKVQRHKELRSGKGFKTLEYETLDCTPSLNNIIHKTDSTILIECISNLVANEMFIENKTVSVEKVITKIQKDFNATKSCSENLIIVSNNVFDDGIEYDKTTKEYMKALGAVNTFIAGNADKITEVVCGIPVEIK